jgi:pyruvate dehydrogenase E2 component (dihydrolipoamide acetyltransferase)
MIDFTMPSLGADMEAATLMCWKVDPGATVKRGDIVAEVETDKGLIEIEVFHNGTIEELVAKPGDKLPVGAVLARIRDAGSPAPTSAPAPAASITPIGAVTASTTAPAASPPPQPLPIVPPPAPAPLAAAPAARVSPLARKVAAALGVDLATVTGTGPGGAIERADVEQAAARSTPSAAPPPPAPAPAPAHAEALPGMRRAIAAAMARSNREIPHYYLATRIDMSRALAWLEEENGRRSIQQRLLPAAVLLAAVARTLKGHPDLNGVWKDDRLVRHDAVHINFAITTRQGGLITPALHDVDQKSVGEIMVALHDLIPRARDGGLRSSELSEGTITVTSLGDLGVETVFGVIYPPQVAIIGFGRITEQPWAENGLLGVRPVLQATLAGDHRATDGRTGARFLDALNRQFQHPESL